MMHGDRSRDPPPYHPGWGGLARKLVLEEYTGHARKKQVKQIKQTVQPHTKAKSPTTHIRQRVQPRTACSELYTKGPPDA